MVETVSKDLRNIGTITLLASSFNPCDPSPPSSRPPRGLPDWPEICWRPRSWASAPWRRCASWPDRRRWTRVKRPGLLTRPFPWVSGSALTAMGVRRTLPPKRQISSPKKFQAFCCDRKGMAAASGEQVTAGISRDITSPPTGHGRSPRGCRRSGFVRCRGPGSGYAQPVPPAWRRSLAGDERALD